MFLISMLWRYLADLLQSRRALARALGRYGSDRNDSETILRDTREGL
jgi:hypothetical protein